ncbi:MAG: UDP-N-acetylmuramoyl-tripeptide--D-alanyl-D-alanine ligase [Bacteroidetes bacterium]|nr:UDP-N-acetylmuramoyl-tripeptide--D-alanyl-D-alanine ligase [Bacteroidota bacterium]
MTTTEELYRLYKQHPIISTDTRRISPDCLFFALKGENFDANTFAGQAIEQGASYAIIDDPDYKNGDQYLLVENVLSSLQNLARHHRRQLMIPVIGLTGTNGKTTTKELINAVLSQQFNTYATQGNLNNHIGVPLTILSINSGHEAAVIEMGANHQKEIELLCSISQPSHGMITNVGKAHLEGFGGVEGVKKGKGELYDFLAPRPPKGGVAFVNCDDAVLVDMARARGLDPIVYYGESDPASLVSGKIIDNSPLLTLEWTDRRTDRIHAVETQLTGEYNLPNILAAICIGLYFNIDPHKINAGISGYQPKNNRSQVTKTATNTLICDYYNANPSSMAVAIDNLGKLTAGHKVLVLGDMFEMGDEAAVEHAAVVRKALETDVDERFFIGTEFSGSQRSDPDSYRDGGQKQAVFLKTVEEAIAAFKDRPIRNSTVLIKGSRGMALERLVELF